MNTRRLTLAILIWLCVLVCVLAVGAVAAAVASTQFAPGQVVGPEGVAVDQASGDVYVANAVEGQVDVFDGSGSLLRSFGKALFGETPRFHGEPGPGGVAVDNELLSLSYGDVYVVDWDNSRVDKFDSSGKFLLMFGGDVNETTGGNVCVAGEACKKGTRGTADGQFEFAFEKSYLAVGPGGAVYVGDRARVQVFEPSGAWRENVSLSALSSTGKVTALAVDSTGDMFVKIGSRANIEGAVAGVRELEPNGTEKGIQFDAGSESVEALALDESGDVFVADSSGGGHVSEYDSTGKQLASFGSNTVQFVNGLAYTSALGQLYVSGQSNGTEGVWVLTPPVLGPPTIEAGSVSAVPAPRGQGSLSAKLNPGGFDTTYHFEYVDGARFQASGYANASSTPDVVVGSSLEEQSVSTALTELTAGDTYHYRLVATNSKGTVTSIDQTFDETPPVLIKGPWSTNVASTSTTLNAEINPLGASAEYRLEYGTSTSYGQTLSGNVGEGEVYVPIDIHRQELASGTTYHFRLVVHNAFGTVEGSDHVFTTQVAVGGSALSDGRVWELVSPANKKGALIEPFESYGAQIQAASDGSGITYLTSGPHVGEDPMGKITVSQVLSRRGSTGWGSVDMSLPSTLPENGEQAAQLSLISSYQYPLFSIDLSLAAVEPAPTGTPLLSPEATARTVYLRDSGSGSFLPLVTSANVPFGSRIDESGVPGGNTDVWEMHFLAATPDLSHVVLKTPMALTPDAIDEESVQKHSFGGEAQWNLYEWSGGKLQLVNILPNNQATHGQTPAVRLAGMISRGGVAGGSVQRVVSSDGRRVAWTLRDLGDEKIYKGLYVRDMVEGRTVQVGGQEAAYQTMNSDGSRIFYLEKGDLHELDFETGTQTDLTGAHGPGESDAGVEEVVSDVSEDGSYVYFVATGALTNGGVSGKDNLYLLHHTGGGWRTTYIATLSHEDERSWHAKGFYGVPDLSHVSSRVSPNGRYLAFMSSRSLTGYDNTDAVSGALDEEVYLYDAETEKLVCASCDPTNARPVGVFDDERSGRRLVDREAVWTGSETTEHSNPHWLAGSIPGWDAIGGALATYQPRYLSDSGRLFFNSPDALVPHDTNGLEDVYEYEPTGVGGCNMTDVTFNERSDGCVGLISSGTASTESVFYDASESGDDVFFDTAGKLVGEDYDRGYDVYDAHVCTVTVPCRPVPVSSPPCTSGDSCKAAPSPQPEIFGPAPSATFNGVGNLIASPSKSVVAPKSLTRARKLAQALKACRKKKARRRGVCEARAEKRYGATRSGEAKATRKGNR